MEISLKLKAAVCIALGAMSGLALALMVDLPKAIDAVKWALGIFGFLWTTLLAFMAKLSDVTDVTGISYQQHAELDRIVKTKVKRLWAIARSNVLGVCMTLIPLLMLPENPDWAVWLLPIIGGLIGTALFCVLLYEDWLEELRSFRSQIKFNDRMDAARDKLLAQVKDASVPVQEGQEKKFEGYGQVIH